MILVNTPSFLATTTETQTPVKIEKLVVNYSTRLGSKDDMPQGYIDSYVSTETSQFVYNLPQIEMESLSGNILAELHDLYILHFSALNPSLTFTSTL
jgi:hypothetical protein